MDGNRRFAKSLNEDPIVGHEHGANKLKDVVLSTFGLGIKYLTVWGFSTENVKRSAAEVEGLYDLFETELQALTYSGLVHGWKIRVRVIGEKSILPCRVVEAINSLEEATASYSDFNLQLALAYGGHAEIVSAVNRVKRVDNTPITAKDIEENTYCGRAGIPPVEGIVRTSGEYRLSGFMLWECAYAEFAIVAENWPELREITYLRAISDLSKRQRRFGK